MSTTDAGPVTFDPIVPADFDLSLSADELAKAFEALYAGKDLQSTALARSVSRFEVKADSVDMNERTFEGLAATWDLDRVGDVIVRGAFKRTLGIWRKGGHIVPLLDSHDRFTSVLMVVGKMVAAKETAAGLLAKFEVVDDERGNGVLTRLVGGFISALSIGYRPIRIKAPNDQQRRAGIFRFLEEVALRETSVVVFGANDGAHVKADPDEPAASAGHDASKDADPPKGSPAPDEQHSARAQVLRDLNMRRLASWHSPKP